MELSLDNKVKEELTKFQPRWTYSYDSPVVKLTDGVHTIVANGQFKTIDVPGTVLRQHVDNLKEMLDAISIFVFAIDSNLLDIAKRWIDAEQVIHQIPWSIQLLTDVNSLEQLERVADSLRSKETMV